MGRITTVHAGASVKPSKLELLAPWLRLQPWFQGDTAHLTTVGNFRFEDPTGEVGMDSLLIESRGDIYYVPVTWRSRPVAGPSDLIGQADHSVLGRRFCYDAMTDPAFIEEATRVIVEGDTNTEVHTTAGEVREATVRVKGNGVASNGRLRAVRRLGTYYPGRAQLIAHWTHNGVEREDILAAIG